MCAGQSLQAAADRVGVSRSSAGRTWRTFGHMALKPRMWPGGLSGPVPPDVPGRRALTSEDRATIQAGLVLKLTYDQIGELIGRNKSTVSREIRRNSSPNGQYRGCVAHRVAAQRRCRPKPFKLIENTPLCRRIEAWMDQGWSPRLISHMLVLEHGGDHTQTVSHETIYHALYVQARVRCALTSTGN
jgi:transposase, IS30 family